MNQIEKAIKISNENYIIYLNNLFDIWIKNDNHEELGCYLNTMLRDRVDKSIFGISPKEFSNLLKACQILRTNKLFWFDDELSTPKRDPKLQIVKIQRFIKKFRTLNSKILKNGIQINSIIMDISKLFELTNTQRRIIQFFFDRGISSWNRNKREEYNHLLERSLVKDLFQNNIFEIINGLVVEHKKSDVEKIIDYGILCPSNYQDYSSSDDMNRPTISFGVRSNRLVVEKSEGDIMPYSLEVHPIYFNLVKTNEKADFESVLKYFQPAFKSKLSYEDFQTSTHTPIIEKLVEGSKHKKQIGTNILLYGLAGTGKTEMVYALAKKNSWNLVVIGEGADQNAYERLSNLKFAQNFFKSFENKNIVFLFDEMEDLLNIDIKDISKNLINRLIENTPFPTFWTSNNLYRYDPSCLRRMTYAVKFDVPSRKQRRGIWDKCNIQNNLNLGSNVLDGFAEAYNTVPSIINNVSEVSGRAGLGLEETKNVIESLMTVYNRGRDQKPKDNYAGNFKDFDFSLANTDMDLQVLAEKLKNGNAGVFSMCLHGAPGTGKSAFARYLAKELRIKIIYKKASDLISMYLGETEQNIADAFREANDDEAMLVFDEADSFLQDRRGAIRSWEVSQVNEMLCQMENSKMPFICTTNLMEGLDQAALRRFVFKIGFKWMEREQIELACKSFFNVELDIPKHWKLSPGDFVSVKKRADILGVTDKNEFFDILKQEYDLKNFSKPIGF